MQTTSLAVGTTVIALVVALAVTVVSARRPSGSAVSADLASASASARPAGAAGDASVMPGGGRAPSGAPPSGAAGSRGPIRTPGEVAGAPPGDRHRVEPAPTATGDAGERARPSSTTSQPAVTASSDGEPAEPAGTALDLRAAAPGDWYVKARITDRTALLGPQDTEAEGRIVVGPVEDGLQRFDAHQAGVTVIGETARIDTTGRRALVLDLRAGGTEPLRFRSADGFLDTPARARPGMTWAWTGQTEDARTSLDARSRVVRLGRTTLGDGREVDVVELEQVLTLGGDRSMTITRDVRFAPSLGMVVWLVEETKGTTESGGTIDKVVTLELMGGEPAPDPVLTSP